MFEILGKQFDSLDDTVSHFEQEIQGNSKKDEHIAKEYFLDLLENGLTDDEIREIAVRISHKSSDASRKICELLLV